MEARIVIEKLMQAANSVYDEREARNVVAVLMEDLFGFHLGGSSENRMIEVDDSILDHLIKRIENKEPPAYISEISYFYNLVFKVTPDVLIPRPETEELVYLILEQNNSLKQHVLDIGTGSGCIPITLKKLRPNWHVHAIDISEKALAIAKQNAKKHQTQINFLRTDILDSAFAEQQLPKMKIIISNPPYIPLREKELMPESVLDFEPEIAYATPNDNPHVFYKAISQFAGRQLEKNGKLYFEINEFHANDIYEIVENAGFSQIEIMKDLQGKDRMLKAVYL